MEKKIIRLPDVLEKVSLKKSAVYKQIKLGNFPAQIKLGMHASGWLESDIDAWISGKWSGREMQARSAPLTQILDAPMESEVLRADEVAAISGHKSSIDQAKWLTANSWRFHVSGEGKPVVGRMYARLKMCGIEPRDSE